MQKTMYIHKSWIILKAYKRRKKKNLSKKQQILYEKYRITN